MAKPALFVLPFFLLAACGGRGPAPAGSRPPAPADTAVAAPGPAPDTLSPPPPDSVGAALADCRFPAARAFANTYCADCHTRGGTHMAQPKAIRKLAMDTYAEWLAGSRDIPGRLNLDSLEGKAMPPSRFSRQPTAEERRMIIDWVRRGSPNTEDGR